MTVLLVLPLLVPLGTAAASLLAWRCLALQRGLAVGGAALLLAAGLALLGAVARDGILAVQVGGWPAPFGITLVADLLAAVMVVLAGTIGLAVVCYSLTDVDEARQAFGYWPLVHVLLMGVCGAFLTGDVFDLFVWFEVLLIASFVLLALGGGRAQLEGAMKYVTLNLLSSALFLTAVGVLYGIAGTLNLADLVGALRAGVDPGLVATCATLFLVAFGIKAAVFPFFFWLPASYHTAPVAVAALFAGLLTKVGVYALLRLFTLLFVADPGYTHELLLVLAGLTMVTGVLGAVAQTDVRRLLAFHIVSQIGYLLMGLGLLDAAALAAAVVFMIHVVLAKSALFLVAGVVHRTRGTYELARLGGLVRARPALAALFLVPAMSLAGLPPLSGFFAKLALVQAGLARGRYAIVATALVVSILTLFSMTKIWAEAFWKPAPDPNADADEVALPASLLVPIAGLAGLGIAVGIAGEPVFRLAGDAAAQLLDPAPYVAAVMGADA
jgi:multicomponent Na+:H+ antiporter subunit D